MRNSNDLPLRARIWLLTVAMVSLAAAHCHAQVDFLDQAAFSYRADLTDVVLQSGQSVTFNLFLVESGSASLLLAQQGLNSAGARIQRVTSGPASALSAITGFQLASDYIPAGGLAPGQRAGTGGFDFVANGTISHADDGNDFTFSEVAAASVPTGNSGNGITTPPGEIYLGSITVTGAAVPGSTDFTLGARGAPNNWTTTSKSLLDLDVTDNSDNGGGASYTGAGARQFTFRVTVVPEPGTSMLCAAACVFHLLRRRSAA